MREVRAYVVRIYRQDSAGIAGVVESVESGEQLPFHAIDELWYALHHLPSSLRSLMRCYDRLGKRTEALSVYRRLRHTLSVLLGVKPSDAAQHLFQSLLGGQDDDPVAETAPGRDDAGSDRCAGAARVRMLPVRTRRAEGGTR